MNLCPVCLEDVQTSAVREFVDGIQADTVRVAPHPGRDEPPHFPPVNFPLCSGTSTIVSQTEVNL